jgi:hypothetical protein
MNKEKRSANAVPLNPHKKVSTIPHPTGNDKKIVSLPSSPLASLKERTTKKDPQEVFQMLDIIGKGFVMLYVLFIYKMSKILLMYMTCGFVQKYAHYNSEENGTS